MPKTPTAGKKVAPKAHRTRVVFGLNTVDQVGALAREIGIKKVLLVTDPGITEAGHTERVKKSLKAAKISTVIYGLCRENPTTRDVDACLKVARGSGIDGFVGLGGGSSLDTAKGCNFLLTNGGRMQDYWGIGKATKAMLPLIAIPTTSGTGSECQSFALIADENTHIKMACGDPKAAARVAILDPVLTISQPFRVTACAGIDALAHALETAVTTKRNPVSLTYSYEAFNLCATHLPRALTHPNDLAARSGMLLGAALAGMAIENSMLGAAHAAANPLTAHYGIIHGQSVGMMLPHVVRFNAGDAEAMKLYGKLNLGSGKSKVKIEGLIQRLESILKLAKMPKSLSDCGVKKSAIPMLASEAAKQWTAGFNPRTVTEGDFVRL